MDLSGYEDISPDGSGGVMKRVITPGPDPTLTPESNSVVTCYYEGKFEDGKVFDAQLTGSGFSFDLGRGQVIKAWDVALATMATGEKCEIVCAPEFAYGKRGSPPRIPENAVLIFQIELLTWKVREKSRSDMSTTELLAGAAAAKATGTQLFKQGKYAESITEFAEILNWLKHIYVESDLPLISPVKLAAHLNLSLAHLKLKQYSQALDQAEKALGEDEKSVKAMVRLAQAQRGKGELEEARNGLIEAIKKFPNVKMLRNEYEECKKEISEAQKEEQRRARAMFAGGVGDGGLYPDEPDPVVVNVTAWDDLTPRSLPQCFLDVSIGGEAEKGGRIVIELRSDVVPITAENFRLLCSTKKYQSAPFHRVIKGFMIQGGDYESGDGTGGQSAKGGSFADENFLLRHDRPMLLSMANSGPATNGSQFFITCDATSHLDGKHVVFGRVIAGANIVRAIEGLDTDTGDEPKAKVIIEDCGELEDDAKVDVETNEETK